MAERPGGLAEARGLVIASILIAIAAMAAGQWLAEPREGRGDA